MKSCPNCGINLDAVESIAKIGDLTIDLYGDCWWNGQYVTLSAAEIMIVHAIATASGRFIMPEALFNIIDSTGASNNIINVYVCRIRKKFRAVDPGFDRIATDRGRNSRGYRWRVDQDAESPCEAALERV